MSQLDVFVYDDELSIARGWAASIETVMPEAKVTTAGKDDFRSLLELLNARRSDWREPASENRTVEPHPVDSADVIFVDYDLISYSNTGDTTGSRLAYLLRCFSGCGYIVILNEYGTNAFDLSLRSPTEDFADLHIGGEQIGNPGLWQPTFKGYRPWYWPVLPHARTNFELCVNDVLQNLEKPILEFLGLDGVVDWIPPGARDFIQSDEKLEKTTFRGFIESTRGKAAKDKLIDDQLPRVAAARIGTWLNSIILPEQSLLVDAPHLVSRFPSLVLNERDIIDTWNTLCNPVSDEVDDLLHERLREHKFKHSHWLWRPAWYWPRINSDETIEEVKNPWAVEDVDWVFCENVSRFIPLEAAQEFRAIVSPPFIKRYVLLADSPILDRNETGIGLGGAEDPLPSRVDYVPQVAFSI